MSTLINKQAPNFTLFNAEKTKVSLEHEKGKNVLLLFFPLAYSSVCTNELCMMRDNLSIYNTANAVVFGISVDSVFVLKKFKEDLNLNFELLSDFNKDVSKAYNVFYDIFPAFEMHGVSKRAAFVIDANGMVQYEEICASPGDLPDFEAIEEKLKVL